MNPHIKQIYKNMSLRHGTAAALITPYKTSWKTFITVIIHMLRVAITFSYIN